jgi:hypothetical protein
LATNKIGKETSLMPKLRVVALGAALLLPFAAHAEVVRFEVVKSEPAFEGRSFGSVGAYVKITGRALVAVDPGDPRNAIIADIDKAPRDENGKVEATADVVVIRPADPQHANGTLLVDIANRGLKLAPQLFDDSPQPGANNAEKAGDAGTGFLESHGYTLAWIGWQADIPSKPGQIALEVPVVKGITGPARDEFVFDNTKSPIAATLSSSLGDPSSLKVSVRAKWDATRETPAGLSIKSTGPRTVEITRPATGFDAGALYEVTYTAKDPAVLGLGFASTRDVVSFLRRNTTADNPLFHDGGNAIKRAIGFGVSQSGRYLRDFLYLGFNEDLSGGLVFDGLMPHVAGSRRMALNYRFGQPGRNARHPQDPAWQDDLFPFTYDTLVDPLSGRRDGLMQRCRLNATCPKVIQTDSEHEWWASHASLVVTDLAGNHIDLPPDVRMYMIAGSPHYAAPDAVMKKEPAMALPVNPNHAGMPMRASGTLVDAANAVPRNIPGLPYTAIHTDEAVTDTSVFPPKIIGLYPVFVPRADNDGMAIAGIHMLQLAVPRASYTGWNPRSIGYGPGALYPLQGAVIPFAATKAEREASGDPRLSIAERYPDTAAYVAAVKKAAAEMVAERLLLPEDAAHAIELATEDKLSKLH